MKNTARARDVYKRQDIWFSTRRTVWIPDCRLRAGRLQMLAFSLERQPAERQAELKKLVREGKQDRSFVWFSFPEKYFHGYDPIFNIEEGLIYMDRGDQNMVFYKDNGFIQCVEELAP